MTERLKQMLDGEAHGLDVPPPATDAVLRQGRGLRRRSRMTVAAAGVAAAVVVGGSFVALSGGDGENTAPDPASPVVGANAVFSYGTHVFYDGPGHQAEIQDKAVKSLYYTSAGVLVRHGNNSSSDGGGPQRFSLVTPEGDVEPLGLVTEETVHASDPDEPYVVYGEAVDGELQVVVYDVAADSEEARVTVGPTTESWFPVSIDGATVYVQNGYEGAVSEVDWEAGTAADSDLNTAWEITGGWAATEVDGEPSVVDIATGEVKLSASDGYFDLSPDGRFALLNTDELGGDGQVPTQVFGLDSDSSVTLMGDPYGWGWTADGDLFQLGKDEVRTCDSATGECTSEPFTKPAGTGPESPKLGGRTYES